MNRILQKIFIAATPLMAVACGNASEKQSIKSDTIAHHNDSLPAQTVAAVVIKDVALNALYGQYQELTKALTEGNDRAAIVAANALAAGAQQLKEPAIAKTATAITTASGLDAKRALFAGLSNDMITKVKKAGVQQGTLYVDFCPMALDDKGAHWLSAEKEVKNPYFGEEMMNCGNVEDSIH